MIEFQIYFIWISKDNHKYWMFAVFTWTTKAATHTKKQNMLTKTYKKLLGTWIKSQKLAYTNTVCTKSTCKDSTNCFTIFGSSACQGQHVFSMSFLTCTAPRFSHTNVQELFKLYNHNYKTNQQTNKKQTNKKGSQLKASQLHHKHKNYSLLPFSSIIFLPNKSIKIKNYNTRILKI